MSKDKTWYYQIPTEFIDDIINNAKYDYHEKTADGSRICDYDLGVVNGIIESCEKIKKEFKAIKIYNTKEE